jgi:hypothetical protein
MHRPAIALLCSAFLTACTPATEDTSGDDGDSAAITAGQVVAGDSPYYWAKLSLQQHLAALTAAGVPQTDATKFTSVDDPLRDRLQTLSLRLDTAMRAISHNTAAPSPNVLLLPTAKTFNAWSSGTFARLGATVGDQTMPLPDGQFLYLSGTAAGTEISPLQMPLDAFVHPVEWSRPASFTQVWNLNPSLLPQPACKLKVASGHVLATDPACAALAHGSVDALVPATSPFLTVGTDLVASFTDERTMVFVMAHELGHMYRAHTSPLTVRKYDFWYDQGPIKATRPLPAADAATLGAEYRAVNRSESALDQAQGSTLPVALRVLPLMAAVFTDNLAPSNPGVAGLGMSACPGMAEWNTANAGGATQLINNIFSAQVLAPESQAAYLALESLFIACAPSLHFSIGHNEAASLELPWIEQVLGTAGSFGFPAEPADNETDAAFLPRAQMAAMELEARADAFRVRMNDNRIGLYTIEQEADEVAAELMIRAGYSREDVLAGWVEFGKAFDAKYPRPELDTGRASAATCEGWMKNDFQITSADGTKTPVVMTLGDLSDTHHGDCYRLYNLWRETRSHRYPSGAAQPALEPAWSELVAHATELTTAAGLRGD